MRIFYGKVNTRYGGVKQLKSNYLTGSNKWFGDLKEGDVAIIAEDSQIKNIRKVEKIESINDYIKKYYFSNLLKEEIYPPKSTSDIVYTKYFKLNISSAINPYRQSFQNFNELVINPEYENMDFKNFSFEYDSYNSIYITTDTTNIKGLGVRDYIFVVSNKESGYMLEHIYNVLPNLSFEEISLNDISHNFPRLQ